METYKKMERKLIDITLPIMENKLKSLNTWWRIILFLFKIIEYGVSWLRKWGEIPTGH